MSATARGPRGAIAHGIALFFAGVIGLALLYVIRQALLLVYVAGLLAIGFSPLVRRIEQRRVAGKRRARLPRWAAILIVYVLVLGTFTVLLWLIIPPIVSQARELWSRLPDYADQLQRTLTRYRIISHHYTWSEMLRSIPAPGGTVVKVLGAIQDVLGVLGALATVLVLPYYFLLEAHSLQSGFLQWFAPERRGHIAHITREVTVKVSAWLSGQLVLSFIIGGTAALGLWLLDVPYFYVLALVCGFGELIPVVGPILAAIPAILVGLTVSAETGLFTAVYFLVQQFAENHFLVPRVMQQQVGVSASTVIVSLLIGSELLGIVGALLAVPTAAIVQVLIQQYLADRNGGRNGAES